MSISSKILNKNERKDASTEKQLIYTFTYTFTFTDTVIRKRFVVICKQIEVLNFATIENFSFISIFRMANYEVSNQIVCSSKIL